MTPDEELNALEAAEALRQAGLFVYIVWPHEEVVSMDQFSLTVYNHLTDTLITKRPQ